MFCPMCGAPNEDDSVFCGNCGAVLNPDEVPAEVGAEAGEEAAEALTTEPEPKKGMSGWLIALIVVLALIVVCCIGACVILVLSGSSVGNAFSTIIETIEAATSVP